MPRALSIHLLARLAAGLLAISSAPARASLATAQDPHHALIEVESLDQTGGWVVDQQFMDLMGSPYLLAHGLGIPVPDAKGTVELPCAGTYRVWVRTRDWVAPWNAPGAPGRFQVLLDGAPLKGSAGASIIRLAPP